MKKRHDVKSGEWAKHLRKFGKRVAAKTSRRNGKKQTKVRYGKKHKSNQN